MGKLFPTKDIVAFVSQTPLMADCNPEALFSMINSADQQRFKAGSTILPAGRPVSGLGLLLRGKASLKIVDASSGSETQFEQLRPGHFFGDVGLMLERGNPLAVVADEDCDVLFLTRQQMERLFQGNYKSAVALAKQISSRFTQLTMIGMGGGSEAKDNSGDFGTDKGNASRRGDEIQWVDVGAYHLNEDILKLIPSQLILKHRMLPLDVRGKKMTVGLVSPKSIEAVAELRRVLHGMDPTVVAISPDDFNQAVLRWRIDTTDPKMKGASMSRSAQVSWAHDREKDAEKKAQLYIEGEVISLLDRILTEAIDLGASDIHIEPESTGVRVRYRVQGSLVERKEIVTSGYAAPLIARIKVLSDLDITERRVSQDGRISAQVGKQEINMRVSTIPVARGEKAVIRIVDSVSAMRPLHHIFLNADLEKAVRTTLSDLYGAIVVAGPTGSGKSSTLYSMLNERRVVRPDNNIVTVEDPVEFMLQGVSQVPVRPRVNFGFAQALHGLMRQDPDVIMIGELRDQETTTIMVEAALTGHMVLTSIHGNHATAVIQRLQHLGSDAVLLSQSLSIVIVQRLAKRLCPKCVGESEIAPAVLESLVARKILSPTGSAKAPKPVGCDACKGTGYLGRVPVQEVLNFDDSIRATLASGASPEALIEKAKEKKRFFSFAQAAAFLMARKILAPSDALLLVAD